MAEDAVRIRLQLETNEARRQLDRFEKALEKEGKEAASRTKQAFASVAAGASGVASGAIQSLGTAGSGVVGAGIGALRGAQQAAPQVGQSIGGAAGGPVGAAAGRLVGTGVSAGTERAIGPEIRALARAQQQVVSLLSARAASGQEFSQQQLAAAIKEAYLVALRQERLQADTTRAAERYVLSSIGSGGETFGGGG